MSLETEIAQSPFFTLQFFVETVALNPKCDTHNKSVNYVEVSAMERSQPKGFTPKMRGCKLRSGVYL